MGSCHCSVESTRSVRSVNLCSHDVSSSLWHRRSRSSRNAGSYLYLQRLRSKPNTDLTLPARLFFPPPLSHNRIRHGQVESWIQIIFPIFVEVHVCVLSILVEQSASSPLKLSLATNRKVKAFWNMRNSVIVLFLLFFWHFWIMGSSEQLCYRGVFGLEQCHCLSAGTTWFVQYQIKCPYPNQVFRQPLLLFFVLFFPSCFEDEAFCVSTGYSNLWCPFSLVCKRKC